METAKRWFGNFRSKEKPKTSRTKNEPRPNGKEGPKTPLNEETPSNATKQKVAAAKEYIEKHYKEQMKSLQERRERRNMLEKKLADAQVSEEEQNNLLKYLEKKETEYMRRQRHKMGADDFEPLTMIGKGAFGEAHPWFKGIEWNKLYQMKAAFIPEVNDELDTQNFEKFEETDNQVPSATKSGPWRKMLPSKDANFMGYTYKNFEIVNDHEVPGIDEESNSTSNQQAQGSFLHLLPPKLDTSKQGEH
ncbi:UNVERIFIED_CONTAM: Serine/threonine-protein kinase-like [Sesamum latifolium]|uniref:Serine/threonine-protein kinase-like n=1 Tax=Sesamum latifolium TaxID=2727402 RepID=A0AAW2VUB0_9LAMI